MAYHSFEKLEVWQKACKLAVKIYDILATCKDYGLKDQMTRSAISIASNIAEGAERDSHAEFKRFLHIAKGSAAELRTQVYIASRIKIIPKNIQQEITSELKGISGMIYALVKSLDVKLKT